MAYPLRNAWIPVYVRDCLSLAEADFGEAGASLPDHHQKESIAMQGAITLLPVEGLVSVCKNPTAYVARNEAKQRNRMRSACIQMRENRKMLRGVRKELDGKNHRYLKCFIK